MTEVALSVVIPTYRGAAALPELLDRIAETLRGRWTYEVIVVNDASPDETWSVLCRLASEHPELRAIDLLHNRGQATATLCGIAHSQGLLVATMDDDLQHPPEELPVLLEALAENPEWDVAVGTWPRDDTWLRNLGSWVNGFVDRLAHKSPSGFRHTAFRVMGRPVADALVQHETRAPVLWALLTRTTNRIHNVPVAHHRRRHGNSGFHPRALAKIVTTSFFQATTWPLRLLSMVGFLCALLAFVLAAVFFMRWLTGVQTPAGWASTFIAVVFFGGVALFGLGLVGEYLSLLMIEVRGAPKWPIRQTLDPTDGQSRSARELQP